MPYEKIGKNEPVCIADEVPFEIPDSWEWVRLADLVSIYTGKKDANFGDPQGKYDFFTCSNEPIKSPSYSYDGEYLIMPGNGANIGLVIYYCGQFEAYQRTYLLQNVNSINLHYLKYHLEYNWKQYNSDKMYGSAIPYIKLGNLQEYLVAFPPLGEQTRIVEKIEKLIPYVEKYDETESEVSVLNSSFPELLRKSILQQAVMGKLVPQDSNDEPASVLLEKIRAEKEALVKAAKLKKDKHEITLYRRDNSYYEKLDGIERCIDDEIPFDIPDTWKWCRFFDVIEIATNLVNSQEYPDYPHIAPDNIEKGSGKLLEYHTVSEDHVASPNHLFFRGQIIYSKIRPLLRKAIIASFDGLCSADMYPLNTEMDPHYILIFLLSDCFNLQVAKSCSSRVKMPKINQVELGKIVIPIPPLNEQNRIVEKTRRMLDSLPTTL